MPSAIKYIPPTEMVARREFEVQLINEKNLRIGHYKKSLRYYEGDQDRQVPMNEDGTDDNRVENLVKITVDRTADYLFAAVPKITINSTTTLETPEEAWAREFIDYNGGLETLHRMALRGSLSGHNYVRVVPVEPELHGDTSFYPRMIVLDPTSVYTYWRADDIADVLWIEYRYIKDNAMYIEDCVKIDHGRQWAVHTYKSKQMGQETMFGTPTHHGKEGLIGSDSFTWADGIGFELVSSVIHTFPIPPIIDWVHLPNPNSYYGKSETDQLDQQDSINQMESERTKILREGSGPTDVLIGYDGDDVHREGNLVVVPDSNATYERVESKSDLSGLNTSIDKAVDTYLKVSRVTVLSSDAKDLQRVTNTVIKVLFKDMESKNNLLKDTYGRGLKKIIKLALVMGYAADTIKKPISEIKAMNIKLDFISSLPVDLAEASLINVQQVRLGTRSLQTAAQAMGDDWLIEEAQIKAEREMSIVGVGTNEDIEA